MKTSMSQNPLVSVIITFLNAEKFFVEAIESVLNQTYTNWELLLIDDGSSDGSTQIALDYCVKIPERVQYLEHDKHLNKGISASRNLGIQHSKGKYIATLDADDIWLSSKLQEQVTIMESNSEIGMVFGDTKCWFGWTGIEKDAELDYFEHDKIKRNSLRLNSVINPPSLLILRLNGDIVGPSMSNTLYRKKVIEEVGGFEENFTRMHEDQAFLSKIYLQTTVYVSETCWDIYRQHPNSCVFVSISEGLWKPTELFYLDWLEKYLSRSGINNPDILKALHNRMWKYKHPKLFKLNNHKQQFLRRARKGVGILTRLILQRNA
jgi:glycosyltransferase involved in cell wall biosynthesis